MESRPPWSRASKKLPKPWHSPNSGLPMKHFTPPAATYCDMPQQSVSIVVVVVVVVVVVIIIIIIIKI
jgi:hypothetical protein